MWLVVQMKQDRIQAMKEKQTPIKDVLSLVLAAIQQREIDEPELSEETVIQMIKKEIKSVRETQQLYISAGRDDEVADEQQKINVLEGYLPQMLSDDNLRALIQQSGMELIQSNRGNIIGTLMKDHRAVIDPARLQIVLDSVLV